MTTVFLIIGGGGLALLAISFLAGELLDIGNIEADGPFSVTTLSAFAGSFGFGATIAHELIPSEQAALAALLGLAAAAPAAYLTMRLVRAAITMRTDATLTRDHLAGRTGVVVSAIPTQGYGEVRLLVAGQQRKFHAQADKALATRVPVFVIATLSETCVAVEETDTLLDGSDTSPVAPSP